MREIGGFLEGRGGTAENKPGPWSSWSWSRVPVRLRITGSPSLILCCEGRKGRGKGRVVLRGRGVNKEVFFF